MDIITVDFETLEKESVTVRDRDTMQQSRIKVKELKDFSKRIDEEIKFREEVGREIDKKEEFEGIYGGSFEHMVNFRGG